MTVRFYVLPIEVRGLRLPKYFAWKGDSIPPFLGSPWTMKDYGSINMCVLCSNISDADHAALMLNADVYSLPVDLDVTMSVTQRSAMNTYLEAHAIPGDWLAPGDTFRSALRTVTSMMLYLQRVLALIGYPSDPFAGLTLNTQYRNIPNPLHDALGQAASELGYTWTTANNDQVRKIFKAQADQWGSAPILFGIATL